MSTRIRGIMPSFPLDLPVTTQVPVVNFFNLFVFALFLKQKRGLLFANLFFILMLPYVLLLIKLRPIELEKIRSVDIQ